MAAKFKKSENPMAHARMQETMQALFLSLKNTFYLNWAWFFT